ncbi:hypothetical protein PG997_010013 [Apiospora hydei]|uniref:Uncharacterized protein n=1 Tax=Apiospora hydei TaxID=1337664 RepID=A0ABR1VYV0_9PEZI
MSGLTGARLARRSLARPSAIGCIRSPRDGQLRSPNGFSRALQTGLTAHLSTANPRATSSSALVGQSPNSPATSTNPAGRGRSERDLSQLDTKRLNQSFFRFDTDVPVDSDPQVRRRWFWGYVALNITITLCYAEAMTEMERNHKKLEVNLGQHIDPEDYKRLVMSEEGPENKVWRFYQNHLFLAGDCAEQGRWHALFTPILIHSNIAVPLKDLILLSVFFRAAWVAGFGRIGTPLVAVCSGAAGGLAFLRAKDIKQRPLQGPLQGPFFHVGPDAVVSGLMTAATVARPRMPFFVGFTPAAFPFWAVCLVGFTPELLQWCYRNSSYPRKAQEMNQKKQAQVRMLQEQHEQAIANRAAELRRHGEHHAPEGGRAALRWRGTVATRGRVAGPERAAAP